MKYILILICSLFLIEPTEAQFYGGVGIGLNSTSSQEESITGKIGPSVSLMGGYEIKDPLIIHAAINLHRNRFEVKTSEDNSINTNSDFLQQSIQARLKLPSESSDNYTFVGLGSFFAQSLEDNDTENQNGIIGSFGIKTNHISIEMGGQLAIDIDDSSFMTYLIAYYLF